MKEQLQLKNHLKEVRTEANLSQAQLAKWRVYQETRLVLLKQDSLIQLQNWL